MRDTNTVALFPHRPNIYLHVKPQIDIHKFSSAIVEELKSEQMKFPKIVIFCRSYTDIYNLFAKKIWTAFYRATRISRF